MPIAGARKSKKPSKSAKKGAAASAAARRRFERAYRPLIERMVAEAIEDRLDTKDGLAALQEPGEIPHDEFWKAHGR